MNQRAVLVLFFLFTVAVAVGFSGWNVYKGYSKQVTNVDQSKGEEKSSNTKAPKVVEIKVINVGEFFFSPKDITAPRGAHVRLTFENHGNVPHNYVIPELGVGTDLVYPGGSSTVEFDAPEKSINFHTLCTVAGHAEAGMVGTLKVQ